MVLEPRTHVISSEALHGSSESNEPLVPPDAWGGLLLFIFLFFDWQQVCVSFGGHSACGGRSRLARLGGARRPPDHRARGLGGVQIFGVKLDLPLRGR